MAKKQPQTSTKAAQTTFAVDSEAYFRRLLDDLIAAEKKATIAQRIRSAGAIASLNQKLAMVHAESRKAAAAEAKRIEKITKADVLAFLRQLDQAERTSLLREGHRIDEEGSVLA